VFEFEINYAYLLKSAAFDETDFGVCRTIGAANPKISFDDFFSYFHQVD
jgi:uncharacterized membrane protein